MIGMLTMAQICPTKLAPEFWSYCKRPMFHQTWKALKQEKQLILSNIPTLWTCKITIIGSIIFLQLASASQCRCISLHQNQQISLLPNWRRQHRHSLTLNGSWVDSILYERQSNITLQIWVLSPLKPSNSLCHTSHSKTVPCCNLPRPHANKKNMLWFKTQLQVLSQLFQRPLGHPSNHPSASELFTLRISSRTVSRIKSWSFPHNSGGSFMGRVYHKSPIPISLHHYGPGRNTEIMCQWCQIVNRSTSARRD